MTRRQQRESTFCIVYSSMFWPDDLDNLIKNLILADDIKLDDYSISRSKNIIDKRQELDSKIKKYLRNWKPDRIPKTSLAILELAIYEILYDSEIPPPISINEAIELTKKYSKKEDAPFVNGVLSSLLRGEIK